PRSTVSIRYYYVDFGISVLIPPDVYPKLTVGELGRDRESPELSPDIRRLLYDVSRLFYVLLTGWYLGIFQSGVFAFCLMMIREDPASRPDAQDALEQWQTIRKVLSFFNHRWELRPREETQSIFLLDVICFVKVARFMLSGTCSDGLWMCKGDIRPSSGILLTHFSTVLRPVPMICLSEKW
ncbi:hypothetical protein BKA93DRAFT_728891, partial [Sparassis latifolia]